MLSPSLKTEVALFCMKQRSDFVLLQRNTDDGQRCPGKQTMAAFNLTALLAYNCITSLTVSMKFLISTSTASRFVRTESHKLCDKIANYIYSQLTSPLIEKKKKGLNPILSYLQKYDVE